MAAEDARSLLVQGIAAAKAKSFADARRYLEWVLRVDPDSEQLLDAWYWLSEVSSDPKEQRNYLEMILANNPGDARARRKFSILNGKLNPAEIIDSDRVLIARDSEPQPTAADRFICPKCGGRMTFSPSGETLACEFCEASQNLPNPQQEPVIASQDFLVAMATAKGHTTQENSLIYVCQGCGASFIFPAQQLTQNCPYCHTSYAIQSQVTRPFILPDGLIPFSITESQAKKRLSAWLKTHAATQSIRVESGTGFYLPAWIFNIGGMINWRCQRASGRDWILDQGTEIIYHTDLIIPATHRLCDACLDEFACYDQKQIIAYDTRYLASWPSETYHIQVGDASLDARQIVLEQERVRIQDRFIAPVRDLVIDSASMLVESFKLVLLPAWITHLNIDGKRYEVLINGQSGAVRSQWSAN